MSKIKKTYAQMQVFEAVSNQYLLNNGYLSSEGTYTDKANTKLSSAIKNVQKQWHKLNEEFQDKLDDLRIDNAAIDEKTKVILKTGNQYNFTKEGQIQLKKEIKILLDTEVELHQRMTNDIIGLNEFELEHFSELVISKQDEPGSAD